MKIQETSSLTNLEYQNTDTSTKVTIDEPVINPQDFLVVNDDRSEGLVIPEVEAVEYLVLPINSTEEMPPTLAGQFPLETTIENGELAHTFIFPDPLLNTNEGSNINIDEPVINPQENFVVDDRSEGLVIPEVKAVEYLVLPINSIEEMPPTLAGQFPLETTVENGELVHTFIFTEVEIGAEG
jgi:aspartokinase-like uncharacterized kinase